MSPQYFLQTYGYLQDRAQKATVRFDPWSHLIKLLDVLLKEKQVIILKARQLGVSYLLCGYALWMAKFSENVKVLFLSQGEEEAFDLIARCLFIDNHLPDFLRTTRNPEQRGFIGFSETGSEIRALPSTEKAGRSTDATLVIPDEWEYHPYAEANFAALKPTIDAGGQFVAIATGDPMKLNTIFKRLYNGAKTKENNFYPIFLGALERPGRDQEWLERVSKDLPSWQRMSEYPLTEAEALGTLQSRKFFDVDVIESMFVDCMESLSQDLASKYKGLVKIYRLPVIGKRYCCFTDPSDGKDDPHATIVIDAITGEQVAESHGKVPGDMCAQIHDDLVRLYNKAFNAYEINSTAGGHFDAKIKELDTPNQCHRLKTDGTLDRTRYGWFTGVALKKKALWGLEEVVRTRQFIPHSRDLLTEFSQFMQPEGEDPQPPGGGHDDYIDATGRAFLLRIYMPKLGGVKIESFTYIS